MKKATTVKELQAFLATKRNVKIGFVPTMGALHSGHLTLLESARKKSDFVIVSIFVNPLQFNNAEDLEKYPRNTRQDFELLETHNCDLVFVPQVSDMYPEDFAKVFLDIQSIDSKLEGEQRKGHFDGVVQVLHRLFSLIKPNEVFFGLKDFQQCLVVQKLLNAYFPETTLSLEPTVREISGLAMSSRNTRLSKEGKELAAKIFETLKFCQSLFPRLSPKEIITSARQMLETAGIKVEYIAIADTTEFEFAQTWEKNKKYITLAAVYIENIRLIDNLALN